MIAGITIDVRGVVEITPPTIGTAIPCTISEPAQALHRAAGRPRYHLGTDSLDGPSMIAAWRSCRVKRAPRQAARRDLGQGVI
jgi:hypothetical protein